VVGYDDLCLYGDADLRLDDDACTGMYSMSMSERKSEPNQYILRVERSLLKTAWTGTEHIYPILL